MIRYVLYIWSSDYKKYCYTDQVEYQAKIIEGEKIRWNMMKLVVVKVEHDLDANVIDLYLEEEEVT
jgi:hypothetical protein